MTKLLMLELNEVNFDYVQRYIKKGLLPNFQTLLSRHGLCETTSEKDYEELEPWIQWVSAHTGLKLKDHGVFRLGDITKYDHEQIWEKLEERGLSVGAVSPMNAKNRCQSPAFFIPDPWTKTDVSAPKTLKKLHAAIVQIVNENAQGRITPASAFWLIAGLIRYANPAHYPKYLSLLMKSRKKHWARALLLDMLLADIFIAQTKSSRVDFASLFLNAAAHIQHHYLFNSPQYDGKQQNPSWYVSQDEDPVLEAYKVYDLIIYALMQGFPDHRLMVATGLHQDPHPKTTFYWRLKNHSQFLEQHKIPHQSISALMSRDFIVKCSSTEAAKTVEEDLLAFRAEDGEPLLTVHNRGADLFVMFTYPNDIPENFIYYFRGKLHSGLKSEVSFVAIKNGQHNGIGYFLDSGVDGSHDHTRFPLTDLPKRIESVF